ncbi:MAG TPA: transglycosylase SLT domain-containing protein, partial [Azonexus sp.]
HFSFRRRLTQVDATGFIEKVNDVLPDYHGLFKQAQIRTNIDWRLIAALAYQESQWDPTATSPTGVRGMMMLTEETADRLGVANRLDAKESILAGAAYLASLRDELPASINEPDRTWMALAAYNLGMGHLRGGRAMAPGFKLNPDTWFDMKKVLPMLSRPEIYSRLKSGRARGGEAVILVENVRAFYDILSRHAPAYSALAENDQALRELRLRETRLQVARTSAASRM